MTIGMIIFVEGEKWRMLEVKGENFDDLKSILHLMDVNKFRYGNIIMNGEGRTSISFTEGRGFRGSRFTITEDEKQNITVKEQIQYENGEYSNITKTTLKNKPLYKYLSERLKKVKEAQNEAK